TTPKRGRASGPGSFFQLRWDRIEIVQHIVAPKADGFAVDQQIAELVLRDDALLIERTRMRLTFLVRCTFAHGAVVACAMELELREREVHPVFAAAERGRYLAHELA